MCFLLSLKKIECMSYKAPVFCLFISYTKITLYFKESIDGSSSSKTELLRLLFVSSQAHIIFKKYIFYNNYSVRIFKVKDINIFFSRIILDLLIEIQTSSPESCRSNFIEEFLDSSINDRPNLVDTL